MNEPFGGGGAAGSASVQRQQHYQRVVEATRAVVADDATMGMKSVFAAVRRRMDVSDGPTAKEVRRALAEIKPKARKPVPKAQGVHSARRDGEVDEHPRVDYTNCRADPAMLSSGGADALLRLLREGQSFVETHRVLLERQAFDIYFVVDNMWNSLVPLEWQSTLVAASASQLAGLSLGKVPKHWPSSLHDFVRTAQSLQLDPTPLNSDTVATGPGAAHESAAAGSWKQHWRGTSPKKRKEMDRMAIAVVTAASAVRTQNIVDVGSGKGYLSSLLALEHGLNVLAVEGNGKFTAAAEERVSRIRRRKATHVRPPSSDMGLQGLPTEVDPSFLDAALSQQVSCGRSRKELDNRRTDSTKPNGPIFVTAMVKAVRDREPLIEKEQMTEDDDANRTDGQNLRNEQQERGAKMSLNTVAACTNGAISSGEAACGGEAGAALLAKEAQSRAMRQQYTTGAAAAAITAAAGTTTISSSAFSTSVVAGSDTIEDIKRQHLKRPRHKVQTDSASPDGARLDQASDPQTRSVEPVVGDSSGNDTAGDTRDTDAGEQSIESLLDGAGFRGAALLVGLHTCGDLAADSCRLFLRTPRLAGMVLCGCCYGRLTEPANFPLSTCGKQAQLQLGYTLRDLATHRVYGIAAQPEVWRERVLYTASYRATLEAFIRTCPAYAGRLPPKAIQHCTVRKNVAEKPTFGAWALAALKEAEVNARTDAASDENDKSGEEHVAHVGEMDLQAYYDTAMGTPNAGPHRLMALEALAACVWPVVEALVVVDRLAFLQENLPISANEGSVNATATVRPLFDPIASPRNWVLVATRATAPN